MGLPLMYNRPPASSLYCTGYWLVSSVSIKHHLRNPRLTRGGGWSRRP